MFANLTGWHTLIILAIVLLVFGAAKLPALAKSVGQSMRILKNEAAPTGTGAPEQPTVAVSATATDHAPRTDAAATTAVDIVATRSRPAASTTTE